MTPERIAGKRATAEMIKGVGGLEASAPYCRVGKSVLGDNGNVNRPDSFVAIDVVADLEPLARDREGWPHVTRWLCGVMGGVFVPLPAGNGGPHLPDLLAAVGRLTKEHGDVIAALCGALADGRLDARDAAGVRREIRDQQEQLAALDAQLAALDGARG